jgi:hypothetical protein
MISAPAHEHADRIYRSPERYSPGRLLSTVHPVNRIYRSPPVVSTVHPLAARLEQLLHLRSARFFEQSRSGDYPGFGGEFDPGALDAHVRGERTIAFGVVPKSIKRALFIAVDVDAEFETIVPFLRRTLEEIGGADLVDASFLTDGSRFGRGKLITTLANPAPLRTARDFANHVERRIRGTDVGRGLEANDLTLFPQRRSGGRLRILGRNPKRNGPVESAYTLDGEPDPLLEHVQPLDSNALRALRRDPSVPAFVERLLSRAWTREEGTNVHFGRMCRLASEALRINGEGAGERQFERWLEVVRRNSPDLQQPSIKNRDPRCVLDHGRQRAWEIALEPRRDWIRRDTDYVGPAVARLYGVLCDFVERQGLRHGAFSVDYATIAAMLDIASKSRAYELVRVAESAGLLVRHHPGTQDAPGTKGLATCYGLVGADETPERVLLLGARDSIVLQRLRHLDATGYGANATISGEQT